MEVQVWNDWEKEHVELYDERTIKIPAKSYIVMNEIDARKLVAKFTPIERDGMGRDLKPKMLRIVPLGEKSVLTRETHKCMACEAEFSKPEELATHSENEHKQARRLSEKPMPVR